MLLNLTPTRHLIVWIKWICHASLCVWWQADAANERFGLGALDVRYIINVSHLSSLSVFKVSQHLRPGGGKFDTFHRAKCVVVRVLSIVWFFCF